MSVRCFFIEPTGRQKLYLRRYRCAETMPCTGPGSYTYHNAIVYIGEAHEKTNDEGYVQAVSPDVYPDDSRWPVKCDHCAYEFSVTDDADKWQVFTDSVYRNRDNQEEHGLREWEKIPGAMWNAWWLAKLKDHQGPDGQSLYVVLPDRHQWGIDGRANNCDSPCLNCGQPYHAHDINKPCPHCQGRRSQCGHCCIRYSDARPHKCWVRHGTPPQLTVDKNGTTCGAGAGSIMTPTWHGFLRNGELVT